MREDSDVGWSRGGAPPRGRGREALEGCGRGPREPAGLSAQHPSRPGAPARTAAVAAASFSPRAPRPSPQFSPNVGRREPGPRRTRPGTDTQPSAGTRRSRVSELPSGSAGRGDPLHSLARGGGTGLGAGRLMRRPDRKLLALPPELARRGASPRREGRAVGRPDGRGVASGGPLASGGPRGRPRSAARYVRFPCFPRAQSALWVGN